MYFQLGPKYLIAADSSSHILVSCAMILMILFFYTIHLNGQIRPDQWKYNKGTSSILEKKYSIKIENVSLHDALQIVSKTTGINIIYSDTLIYGVKNITFNFKDNKLQEILDSILKDTELSYLLTRSNTLIIVKEESLLKRTGIITGTVLNERTGEQLAAVNLQLSRISWGTSSRENGVYRFNKVPEGEYELIASAVGYKKETIPRIKVPGGRVTTVDIHLQPAILELENVVITGNKVPTKVEEMGISISLIDAKQIEQKGTGTLSDLLRGTSPGIYQVDGDFGFGGISYIRGVSSLSFASRVITAYIDGIPIKAETFDELTFEDIERIEIVRGPHASTLYGTDVSEWVMQIITRKAAPGPLNFSFTAAGGLGKSDFKENNPVVQEYTTSFSGSYDFLGYSLGGRYFETDGILPNNRYKAASLNSSFIVATPINNLTLSSFFRYFNQKNAAVTYSYRLLEENPILASSYDPNASRDKERIIGGLNFDYSLLPWWTHTLTLGINKSNSSFTDPSSLSFSPTDTTEIVIRSNDLSSFLGYHSTVSYPNEGDFKSELTVGFEYFRNDEETLFEQSSPTRKLEIPIEVPSFKNMGYFIQDKIKLWNRLFLTGGVRLEKNDYFGKNVGLSVNPRFSVSSILEPTKWWTCKLRGAIGRAIKAPPYQSEFLVINNDLKPETNFGWEIGTDNFLLDGKLILDMTYFNQHSNDLVFAVPSPADPRKSQYVNLGEISNKGLEFAAMYKINNRFLATANYSILFNELESLNYQGINFGHNIKEGEPLEGAADGVGSVFLDYYFTDDLNFSLDVYYLGRRIFYDYTDLNNPGRILYLPSFAKVNVMSRYQMLEYLQVFLKINNLFNNKVDEIKNMPASQLYFIVGLKLTL